MGDHREHTDSFSPAAGVQISSLFQVLMLMLERPATRPKHPAFVLTIISHSIPLSFYPTIQRIPGVLGLEENYNFNFRTIRTFPNLLSLLFHRSGSPGHREQKGDANNKAGIMNQVSCSNDSCVDIKTPPTRRNVYV
jgi:hypothetical protein